MLLTLSLGAAYWVQHRANPEQTQVPCDVRAGHCEFVTPRGEASLALSPQPISSSAPFKIVVSLPDYPVSGVWIDLQGKEMYMGVNQTRLQPSGSGWVGDANLGICTTGTMRWVLNLVVEWDDGQQIYQFEFDAR